ncbi:hypothetical protein HPB50_010281 [Hyalomma asiaticum]|uniref:Uncharacterized protein n=1 Tax=Hyalomma asiaticum TaxID=266040 RepID=A0ACB7SV99_HYAAI|nr:hypothetical protein HPB50_010281 [Hyalomma asiaticum]
MAFCDHGDGGGGSWKIGRATRSPPLSDATEICMHAQRRLASVYSRNRCMLRSSRVLLPLLKRHKSILCVSASDKAAPGGGCRGRRLCAGCGVPIRDQFILRVAPDLEWHAACLKCADCHQFLDETCTCFVRDGKPYCKRDYHRLFSIKCSKCRQVFCRTDFVMRARQHVYHVDCFRCQACERQLMPGDEFALREDGLFCRADHEVLDKFASSAHGALPANGIHVAHKVGGNENTHGETSQIMSGRGDIKMNERRLEPKVRGREKEIPYVAATVHS